MARLCEIIGNGCDEKKIVCIDTLNKASILTYLKKSPRLLNKCREGLHLLTAGIKNSEILERVHTNDKGEIITGINIFHREKFDTIYCKEQKTLNSIWIVVIAAIVYERNSISKINSNDIPLITKISSYEYQIKNNRSKQNLGKLIQV